MLTTALFGTIGGSAQQVCRAVRTSLEDDLRYGPDLRARVGRYNDYQHTVSSPSMLPQMNWQSFTEFFEGEGAVSVRPGRSPNPNVLQICIVTGQKREAKLEQVNSFFTSVGIDSGRICPQKCGYTPRVFKIAAVRKILNNVLPFPFLKREQMAAALVYLEGRIAGDKLVQLFAREYELGKRCTKPPQVSAPLIRLELRTVKNPREKLQRLG